MVAVYYQGSILNGAVNDVPPGPELDSAVAVSYLGHYVRKRQFGGGSWIFEMAQTRPREGQVDEVGPFVDLPHYSYGVYDRTGPAIDLVNHVYDFSLYSGEDGSVWCELDFSPQTDQDRTRGIGIARASDFPTYDDRDAFSTMVGLAICRAALDGIRNLDDEQYDAHRARVREKTLAFRR